MRRLYHDWVFGVLKLHLHPQLRVSDDDLPLWIAVLQLQQLSEGHRPEPLQYLALKLEGPRMILIVIDFQLWREDQILSWVVAFPRGPLLF